MAQSGQIDQVATDDPQQQLCEQLASRITEISSLPALALRIFDVAADPTADAEELSLAIESDPALAARVLRTANSAYYGLRRRVTDLWSCVMLLGFQEVRNLALTVYVSNLFRESIGYGCYNRQQLWRHLVCTAAVARYLCRRIRNAAAEDAYLAGLLHDLGFILIDQYLHREFCAIVDQLSERIPTDDIERVVLGFDHSQLGGCVAEKWSFPLPVVESIRFHHCASEYSGPHADLVNAVGLADYICHLKGITSMGVANGRCPADSVFAGLGIAKDELALLWGDIDEVLARTDAMALMPIGKA